MQLRTLLFWIFVQTSATFAQIATFPYTENFDNVTAPNFPVGWSTSGFSISTSAAQSSPNCVSITGNTTTKQLSSPAFNFTNKIPDKLMYYERRSNTAAGYRLEVRASVDGTNFSILLARFDTISNTTNYVQRIVSLDKIGLQQQSNVRIRWQLLGDNTNTTGVLRLDDIKLTFVTGYDIGISKVNAEPVLATSKDSITLSAIVKNYGSIISSDFSIRFFCDDNSNELYEPNEQFSVLNGLSINAGDSIIFIVTHAPMRSGEHRFIAIIDYPSDENHLNDTARAIVNVGNVKGDALVNEIMYDPLSGQNEWFEIYNRSDQPIDLAHWKFNDRPTSSDVNSFEISNKPFIVESGGYAVVAADSSIFQLFTFLAQSDSIFHIRVLNHSSGFSFNNDEDVVVLKDITGQTIDSVAYLQRWHHPDVVDTKGRSIERINSNIDSNDPRNWSTCTNILGGTPGKANSIIITSIKSNSMISISPNPFSPDGDGFEDYCIIRYNLPLMISTLNIRIYDVKGRLVRTLANSELTGTQGEMVWNGLDDNKQRARIGVYVVFLEATDRSSGRVVQAKAVVVVATKL